MNRLPLIFLGVLLTFAAAWLGFVVYPFVVLGKMQPLPDADTGGSFPPGMSGLAAAGQRVYAANGCVYCHSQQVRSAPLSTDMEKGLGLRHTVARDYLRAQPVFLGTMRTGPDLTNIAIRQPDAAWHHRHLYEPRTVTGWSIMPSFRYLYKMRRIQGQASAEAVQGLCGPHAPPEGFEVVPTEDAKSLVAYLLSLKRDYPLPESPQLPLK
jgi:cytochrome c oxidase cbb3-type subunit 2